MELIYKIVVCHAMGDYVLQNDFLAKTKGENWWHLIIHCILYTAPFALAFDVDWWLLYIFITHIVVDALKARYKKIDYILDQTYHFAALTGYALAHFNGG